MSKELVVNDFIIRMKNPMIIGKRYYYNWFEMWGLTFGLKGDLTYYQIFENYPIEFNQYFMLFVKHYLG